MAQQESQHNQSADDSQFTYRVQDLPARQRPREEMERLGASHVSDSVLLAIILRTGTRGMSVVDLARHMLVKYGSLTNLATVSIDELTKIKGIGRVKAQMLVAALELAKRLSEETISDEYAIKTPEDVVHVFREKTRTLKQEAFWILLLNAKNRLNGGPEEITEGLLDASLVHPREVFTKAITTHSAAIILVHNHPSGDPTPSAEDIRITKQLVQAGKIVDIKVLDHIILGNLSKQSGSGFLSLREAGLIDFS